MDYKIKIYTFNLLAKIDDDIVKFHQYFLDHGINIILDIEQTQITKDDALCKLMQPLDGKYDVVMYLYDRASFSVPSFGLAFNVSDTLRGIYLATDIIDDGVDYTWKSMAHEVMHTLFFKFHLTTIDPMDRVLINGVVIPYYHNEEPNNPDSNFGIAWTRLAPFIKQYTPIAATLTRMQGDSNETLGELVINDFKCKTIERAWKMNQSNISCIPVGTYTCKWKFMLRKLTWHYQVMDIPGRTGIFFHPMNYWYDSNGCIGLGSAYQDLNKDKELDIINSTVTIKAFEKLLNKQDFTLTIVGAGGGGK